MKKYFICGYYYDFCDGLYLSPVLVVCVSISSAEIGGSPLETIGEACELFSQSMAQTMIFKVV